MLDNPITLTVFATDEATKATWSFETHIPLRDLPRIERYFQKLSYEQRGIILPDEPGHDPVI